MCFSKPKTKCVGGALFFLCWSTSAAFATNLALLHAWNFNGPDLFEPRYTIGGATLDIELVANSEVISDEGQGFAGANARFADTPGDHLRLNNPIGSSMILSLPMEGYTRPVLSYETRRSGSGAGTQLISYSIDGENYLPFQALSVFNDDPRVEVFDFGAIAGVADNPDFKIMIEFVEGGGGTVGNNRFDNVVLEAEPLPGTIAPPAILDAFPVQNTWVGADFSYDLNEIFRNLNDEPLIYFFDVEDVDIINAGVQAEQLVFTPQNRGVAHATLSASDGVNPLVTIPLRFFVYPSPAVLRDADYTFDFWSADEPEFHYPDHMIFLQSDISDPLIDDALAFPYFIPADDYSPLDEETIGFPYNNTARTRINGLGENGVSFINTGRGRDLGGALLALDTTAVNNATLDFMAGTILRNNRLYAIRLQYRTNLDSEFEDLLVDGSPIEYLRGEDGDLANFTDFALPAEVLGQGYVQLLWRYYYISGDSGPRPEMRLDDIAVATERGELVVNIAPARAVESGARWRFAGATTWNEGPAVLSNAPAGTQTIEFENTPRWTAPAPIQVTIPPGGTATINAEYESAIVTDVWVF